MKGKKKKKEIRLPAGRKSYSRNYFLPVSLCLGFHNPGELCVLLVIRELSALPFHSLIPRFEAGKAQAELSLWEKKPPLERVRVDGGAQIPLGWDGRGMQAGGKAQNAPAGPAQGMRAGLGSGGLGAPAGPGGCSQLREDQQEQQGDPLGQDLGRENPPKGRCSVCWRILALTSPSRNDRLSIFSPPTMSEAP